jgi:hypothetical protein
MIGPRTGRDGPDSAFEVLPVIKTDEDALADFFFLDFVSVFASVDLESI